MCINCGVCFGGGIKTYKRPRYVIVGRREDDPKVKALRFLDEAISPALEAMRASELIDYDGLLDRLDKAETVQEVDAIMNEVAELDTISNQRKELVKLSQEREKAILKVRHPSPSP
jgi:hypothetical protein